MSQELINVLISYIFQPQKELKTDGEHQKGNAVERGLRGPAGPQLNANPRTSPRGPEAGYFRSTVLMPVPRNVRVGQLSPDTSALGLAQTK